jgi:hypothetical protein
VTYPDGIPSSNAPNFVLAFPQYLQTNSGAGTIKQATDTSSQDSFTFRLELHGLRSLYSIVINRITNLLKSQKASFPLSKPHFMNGYRGSENRALCSLPPNR